MKVKGAKAIIRFDHVGEGLFGAALPPGAKLGTEPADSYVLRFNLEKGWLNAPLAGFAIAGQDRKFVWAKAEIDGDQVVLSSPQVPKPVAVRYGWADYPVVNLYCSQGVLLPPLPASPFRTDDWPMITAPQKQAKRGE
ncbi:MAG TPA: hypothetical protein VEO53_15475 [Candidatus Binatia bacterium]|nr:hypothetical protein [Candidatus Binatia bacterium]